LGSYSTSRYIGKHCSFPTDYFNKKKCFSLLSPLRIVILQPQKQLSLSSLIQSSSFLNLKEDVDKREKEDGEREREREEFMEERKKIDRKNRKKMETRERGRERWKKKKKEIKKRDRREVE
jgi:hypothetical protein